MITCAFDSALVWKDLPQLLAGFRLTVIVGGIGIVGSLVVGVVGGMACAQRVPFLSQVFAVWVEVIRNTPHLVQIFFLYFVLPNVGVRLSAFSVACVSLVLWGGAYNIENFRAGFQAVHERYIRAARGLGFGRWATFHRVTFPNGLRIVIPSVTNTSISVLKGSSLMVAIGFPELTDTAVSIVSQTFRVFEIFTAIGITYLKIGRAHV